ncbi:MAG: STAS/SEC14 domain-containing protein [Cellvibrionales bacterium]|nr:STAS/SEC14 domain-containing protein [Cellvibrionales bacterium]
MIKVSFDASKKLVTLEPSGECVDEDFFTQSEVINQYVAEGNELALLLLSIEKYDHFESFGKRVKNLVVDDSVVNGIRKVAIVTDNPVFDTGTTLGELFNQATLFIYSYCEYEQALGWLAEEPLMDGAEAEGA